MSAGVYMYVCVCPYTHTHGHLNISARICLDYLGGYTAPGCLGCLWEMGWELLFTVYLLYLLHFVPCTGIIYSKNKVFKFSFGLLF